MDVGLPFAGEILDELVFAVGEGGQDEEELLVFGLGWREVLTGAVGCFRIALTFGEWYKFSKGKTRGGVGREGTGGGRGHGRRGTGWKGMGWREVRPLRE